MYEDILKRLDKVEGSIEEIKNSGKINLPDVNSQKEINNVINKRIKELCNCEQSLEYKRLLEKSERLCDLIEFWTNWGSNELIEGRSEFEFMAEVIVPQADELRKEIKKLKSEGGI